MTGRPLLPRLAALAFLLVLALPQSGSSCDAAADERPLQTLVPLQSPADAKLGVDGWLGPGVSGSWFDAARSGEGIIVEMLADGRVLAVWFTYPASGEAGEQAWLFAQDGIIEGNLIRFPIVYRPQGARFGEEFDPADVELQVWGTMELEFASCTQATVRYAGPAAYGSGARNLTRLTVLDELDCNGVRDLNPGGTRALSGLRARSGAWYVPSRAGEGWLIEDLPDGRMVVYWFTYDPEGRQAWTIGVGTRDGDRVVIEDNLITRGTRFGDAFDPDDVQRIPWGRLELEFPGCAAIDASYASTIPGYGSAQRSGSRLTSMASLPCIDGTPAPPASFSVAQRESMPPGAQSEHATTISGGQIYVMGGFGDPRGVKRYDVQGNSWTELPDLPGGRDHLASFATDGSLYAVGGAPQGGGDSSTPAFRFDFATAAWAAQPNLPAMFGSHAATLNGHAYVGDLDGTLIQFDPRTQRSRRIAAAGPRQRDHSQVVAFLGEIWMIGGRFPETNTVAIYDPVSERWRAGPTLVRGRGGFAASVVGNRIAVGGGELVSSQPFRVESSVETYTAGTPDWVRLNGALVDVHGVSSAAFGDTWYVIGGATVAGTASGSNGRVVAFTLPP